MRRPTGRRPDPPLWKGPGQRRHCGLRPDLPDQFEQLAAALRHRLNDGVISIDHIASTAVPGLAAKDIIDLQGTVASLAHADRLAPAFQEIGYSATPGDGITSRPVIPAILACGRSACGRPHLAPGASTRMSALPAGRISDTRCCSGTT